MTIVDLATLGGGARRQAAALLVDAFRELAPRAWPTLAEALDEVTGALEPGKLCRAALDDEAAPAGDPAVLGWVGGIPEYDGNAWELHPLAVAPAHQGRGVGRALVADLEARVAERGGLTLYLGTDDEPGWTTLAGVDVYPDVSGHLARARDLRGHPLGFYLRLGYVIVGVVPDANGFGRPDILMAKRVTPWEDASS